MTTVNVKGACRCKPLNEEELKASIASFANIERTEAGATILQTADGQSKTYELNYHFPMTSSNDHVYSELVAPLAQRVFEGYNATVVSFGTMGSGKSYTLCGGPIGQDPGIIERSAHDLFARISADQTNRYLVTFSMLQIQREAITDVMNPVLDGSLTLNVEDHRAFGSYVPGLCELVVHGADEVREFLQQGMKVINALVKRAANTMFSAQGGIQGFSTNSQPHFIVDIHLESQLNGSIVSPLRYSTFRFVHTAGCGGMAKDTDESLRALTVVIDHISAGREQYAVPFKASLLTRFLEQSLGGNGSTVFIASVSTASNADAVDLDYTLEMVLRAQQIVNRPQLNLNTLAMTMQDVRDEIRKTRSRLNLGNPGQYLNEVDPKILDQLRHLLSELDKLKQQTWENKIAQSQRFAEARKESLHKAGLFIVLEEDVMVDAELMRKIEKERRNLVLQTYVVEQKDSKLQRERGVYTQFMRQKLENPEVMKDEELKVKEESVKELEQVCTHQLDKLKKMKANFSKYVAQAVEMEEKQRKTFLLSHESQRLHIAKDGEDWKEIESLKTGDPKLRDKLKDVQKEHKAAVDAIEARFSSAQDGVVAAEAAKQLELEYATSQKQLREKLEEMRWERDQLLGRLIERDFRHEAQMSRMQKQMFLVFRDYRRHFEEQKAKMELRYRKLVEDSVQDALRLHQRNLALEAQLEKLQSERSFMRIFPSNEQFRKQSGVDGALLNS